LWRANLQVYLLQLVWAVNPNCQICLTASLSRSMRKTRATVPLSSVTPAAWCLLLSVPQCISGLGSLSGRLQRDRTGSAS
jgi:hypothetical protein